MAATMGEKNIGAAVPEELADRFLKQIEDADAKKKVAIRSAIKLWIELPGSLRLRLMSLSQDDDSFKAMVQAVVSDEVQRILADLSPKDRQILNRARKDTRREKNRSQ